VTNVVRWSSDELRNYQIRVYVQLPERVVVLVEWGGLCTGYQIRFSRQGGRRADKEMMTEMRWEIRGCEGILRICSCEGLLRGIVYNSV
jgi:hypothetical protein